MQIDNKYTAALPAEHGVNQISVDYLSKPCFLVDGWEYYPGKLLSSKDISSGSFTPQIIYAGQYSNFSHDLKTPYGVATYRLLLDNHGDSLTLALYLPEIPSAYNLYINGKLIESLGSVSPYMPYVCESLFTFQADKSTEIILQTANYSHYYSGLYYPPAIGSISCLLQMMELKIIIYGFLCFSSLTVALSNLAFWFFHKTRKDSTTLWFGILCIAFSLKICYPFFRMTGVPSVNFLYAFEDFMGSVVLLCTCQLTVRLCGLEKQQLFQRFILPVCVFFTAVSALFPLFILPYAPGLINGYGITVSAFKILYSLWLVGTCLYGCLHQKINMRFLLTGSIIFGISQLCSVLTINRFEPIYGAWPEEYGAYALVVTFAVLMILHNRQLTEENLRLTKHLKEEVNQKTFALTAVLEERKKLLEQLVHDFKAPVTSIRNYTALIQNQNIELDAETKAYIDALQNRIDALDNRFHLLHTFSRENSSITDYKKLCLNTLIKEFYNCNKPDIELNGQTFTLKLPSNQLTILGDNDSIWRVLENLCYNALSFVPENGSIALSLMQEEKNAKIYVSDNGCGIAPENLIHIFESGFTHRTNLTGEGLGLFIARSIILEHGGTIQAESVPKKGTTFIITLPLIP